MHSIGFVVFPNFYLLGFAAVTAFETANLVLDEPAYEVTLISETGDSLRPPRASASRPSRLATPSSTPSCSAPGSRRT